MKLVKMNYRYYLYRSTGDICLRIWELEKEFKVSNEYIKSMVKLCHGFVGEYSELSFITPRKANIFYEMIKRRWKLYVTSI